MFESTGWVLDEPGMDDTNKYDMMMPSVVRPNSAPDIVSSNENVVTEVRYFKILISRESYETVFQCIAVIIF